MSFALGCQLDSGYNFSRIVCTGSALYVSAKNN
jgi:hypothetical protein